MNSATTPTSAPATTSTTSWGSGLRINLRINTHENLSFFVQGQDVWLYGAERDKIIHNTATNLHQIYLDWKPAGSEQWELRAGRQELIYGKQRLLGAFGWDNVSRAFDAGRLRCRRSAWTGDFLWARLVDIRGRGAGHRPGTRDLYGVYFTRSPKGSSGRTELYGFMLRDGLRLSGERGTSRLTRIFTLGVRRHYQPATGFRYEVENAWQLGKRAPDTHHAVATVANAGYAWGGDHRRPRSRLSTLLRAATTTPPTATPTSSTIYSPPTTFTTVTLIWWA